MPDTHFYHYDDFDRTLLSERVQQFRDQGMHAADINQLRGFVAGAVCGWGWGPVGVGACVWVRLGEESRCLLCDSPLWCLLSTQA